MRAKTSIKYSSGRSCAGKVSKASIKCNPEQKSKWKVVDGRVKVSPGDYSIEDLEEMIEAIR